MFRSRRSPVEEETQHAYAHQTVRLCAQEPGQPHLTALRFRSHGLVRPDRRHGTVGVSAQNLGDKPAVGQAIQGQTAAQPEGAFLNLVNWIGNVICPVGAILAVVATVIQWRSGRGWMPSALTAMGLLAVSGITRLMEYFISNGQAIG